MIDKDGKEFEGYINRIELPNGKVYKFQCEVVEIYPITIWLKYKKKKTDEEIMLIEEVLY